MYFKNTLSYVLILLATACVFSEAFREVRYTKSVDEKFADVVSSLCRAWIKEQDGSNNMDDRSTDSKEVQGPPIRPGRSALFVPDGSLINDVTSFCNSWLLNQDGSIYRDEKSFEQGTGTNRPGRFEDSENDSLQPVRPGRSLMSLLKKRR